MRTTPAQGKSLRLHFRTRRVEWCAVSESETVNETAPALNSVEVRVGKLAANVVGLAGGIPVLAAFVLIAYVMPHSARPFDVDIWILLVLLLPLVVAHEALHGLAARLWAGLRLKEMKFGVHWKGLSPYCHYRAALTLKAYRRVTLFPLMITGIASVLIMLMYPSLWSGLFAGTAVAICVGDVWLFLKLKKFDENLLVRDHPTETGCDLLQPAPPDSHTHTFQPQQPPFEL